MNFHSLPFEATALFDRIFLEFVAKNPSIAELHNNPISGERKGFFAREFPSDKRTVLVNCLRKQYSSLSISNKTRFNIDSLLNDTTFTVTCGHQLSLFTGPYFFISKIISTIKNAEKLNKQFPENHYVPVFWMASEDHDFEEINHFRLFGKDYKWDYDSKNKPVGRIKTEDMTEFLKGLPDDLHDYVQCYQQNENLSSATRELVNKLFGEFGLVILDADQADLKANFVKVMEDDLYHHSAQNLVLDSIERLQKLDYKIQLHPREINLFYIHPTLESRERIVSNPTGFTTLSGNMKWDNNSIKDELHEFPERFSPNAILRPVYQEQILPNVQFVGGPAEIAYWLELKSVFDFYQTPFPQLQPRLFAALVPKKQLDKWISFGLSIDDFFIDEHVLAKKVAKNDFHLDFEQEKKMIERLGMELTEKARPIDATLVPYVEAELTKMSKQLADIEKKIVKTAEKKEVEKLDQITKISSRIIKNRVPQEREENIFTFLINQKELIFSLLENSPIEDKYYIVAY